MPTTYVSIIISWEYDEHVLIVAFSLVMMIQLAGDDVDKDVVKEFVF